MKIAKICIVTTVQKSAYDIRVFHKEARTLRNAGYEVTLIAQHDKTETAEGIRIIPLAQTSHRLRRMLFTTLVAGRRALEQKADVYHLNNPELLPVGILLKFLTKRKIVYDIHEDFPKSILAKEYIPDFLRTLIASCIRFIEQCASRLIDVNIAATQSIASNFPPQRTIVVTNYPFISLAETARQREERDYCAVIYIGLLSEERGVNELIQSIKLVRQEACVKFRFIGRFDSLAFEDEMQRLAEVASVEVTPWIPFDEAMNHLRTADIGLILFQPSPNNIESMPNKLFEYMALGVPVIASDFPLWRHIVEDNKCGVCVDPTDPKKIAHAIEFLCARPNLRKTMGDNGRNAVLRKYNWELESKKLLSVYRAILNDQ